MISRLTITLTVALAMPLAAFAQSAPVQTTDPDAFYKLGPDSLPQDGVPKGEIRGPFTLASNAYQARSTLIGSMSPRSTTRPPLSVS
jgi:hypothetical protein